MSTESRSSLVHRYLDPATSLGEILFGLIMTLTFTLGAGIIIQDEGREGARELLIAIIGCNIAWGIIDGALYVVGELFGRGRLRRLGESIRRAPSSADAESLVAGELDEILEPVTQAPDRQALYQRIAASIRSRPAAPNPITKDDLLGGFWSFWLVFLASIPAAIPFVVLDDARLALRISNAILLAFLFISGYLWARYTMSKPWLVGLFFLVGGIALVAAAIALGG
jgi:VIT family